MIEIDENHRWTLGSSGCFVLLWCPSFKGEIVPEACYVFWRIGSPLFPRANTRRQWIVWSHLSIPSLPNPRIWGTDIIYRQLRCGTWIWPNLGYSQTTIDLKLFIWIVNVCIGFNPPTASENILFVFQRLTNKKVDNGFCQHNSCVEFLSSFYASAHMYIFPNADSKQLD